MALVRGTTTSLWFDLVEGAYQGRYGSLSTLVHDTENHLFILTSPDGMQQTFHDFDQTMSPHGEFAGQFEPSGFVTSVESYTASGRIAEIHRTGPVDGQDLTEAFVYTYTVNDQVETLTQQRQLGTSSWEHVRRAVYSYWDGTNSFGNAGDLQTGQAAIPHVPWLGGDAVHRLSLLQARTAARVCSWSEIRH